MLEISRTEVGQLRNEVDRLIKHAEAEYQRGLEEGSSAQAIQEVQGRERFLADVRAECDQKVERLRKLLSDCASVLKQTPPNYFDYGVVEKLWDNACRHKTLLLQTLEDEAAKAAGGEW